MAALPEVIVICIDHSIWMEPDSPEFKAQLDAIQFYCKAKFEAHPETLVSLYSMSSAGGYHLLHRPTSSLEKIVAQLRCICPGIGELNLIRALSIGPVAFADWIDCPDRQLRMLFFIGGLYTEFVEDIGKVYKERGIAVDVVNFYNDELPMCWLSEYQLVRNDLEAFVENCNCNDNSHIVHVQDTSLICVVLSKTILKKTLSLSQGKNQRRNVYGKHIHPFEEGDDCRGLKQILTLSPIA